MTPMLARPATAVQATFEPDEDEPDEDEPDEDEPDEDEEADEPDEEDEDDEELPTLSPDFLSPAPDLSPDEDVSDFLLSDPFDPLDPLANAPAGSALFWLARLSVR
jgi:hypothetical protein